MLTNHVNKVHLSKPTHFCDHCGKDFFHGRMYRAHLRYHNNMATRRRYTCRRCNKEYPGKGPLFFHVRHHSGLKPFGCKFCSYSNVAKNKVKEHLKTHHKRVEWKEEDIVTDQQAKLAMMEFVDQELKEIIGESAAIPTADIDGD